MAVATSLRSSPRSSGLETKSKAPSLRARTADSTLPCAVMTATGKLGEYCWIHATKSSPSPSGSRMSVRQRSKCSLLSIRCAARTDARNAGLETHPAQRDDSSSNSRAHHQRSVRQAWAWAYCSPGISSLRYSSQRCGSANTIRKMLPPPRVPRTASAAPLSWPSSRARNSPRPVPPLPAVKKGSKMRSASAASIPCAAIRYLETGRYRGLKRP